MSLTLEIPYLRAMIIRRLQQKYSEDDAELMADSVLFGELIGRPSHGISRILPGSFGAMDESPEGPPTVTRTGTAASHIRGGPGILVAAMATREVARLAAEHGMAVVATTGSHSTSGSLTYYIEQLTGQQMVALIATNTASFIAPHNASERLLGTNPLAIGIPAIGHPFIADFATSAITGGELIGAVNSGATIPEGVAVDGAGRPTTDPKAVLEEGALLTFGGHKGLALSMTVQLLTGVLGGSSALPLAADGDWSHVFIAISLASLGDPREMQQISQDLIDRIRAASTHDGSEVRIPGHRSLARRDAALAAGTVQVDAATFERMTDLLGERASLPQA
jgi:LDH2 family malate/lactate/ureidoglycolate dehydrogenase